MIHRLRKKIQRIFLAGLLVTVPTMLIFFLLKFLVGYIDRVSTPLVKRLFHIELPGIGVAVTLFLVLTIGVVGTNILGRQLVRLGDRALSAIPLVRSIYSSVKQLIETAFVSTEKPFQQVVLVPYPRDGVYAIGLITREVPNYIQSVPLVPASLIQEEQAGDEVSSVFIPTTPNFTSGLMVMFPKRDIISLSMSVEDGFKYLMSGGILTPERQTVLEGQEEWELFLY
ncbi:hypothetical protein CSB45_13595 [candidate division KSB3 bacterium]|uniref:DUF502 domain-containing protein n=1 Tax=candidate division KSB3 bacterium TaxID=2044937 RepID=A0A2G6E255_9BACT|nr:MAG: hypothetical protein CSB45_13595 [candidate division KSB3 bacterium]PIE28593.1 MAG: hypothetical protein CSA57_13245 [candidate division KSB3 bacterium]